MINSPYLVTPGKKVKLSEWATDDTGDFADKQAAKPVTEKNLEKLSERQQILYAQGKHSLLVVFQAMDGGERTERSSTSSPVSTPQGCTVTSFKVPSTLEKAHDFLWRIHAAAPARGMIGIFNRSHYESVLVERVHAIVPKEIWSPRYEHINRFESLLVDEGTTILKFFLHISWEEQKQRMEARLRDPKKNWKFSPDDLKERERWDDYMEAYEDALRKCSTEQAPWYIVPSDHKWYRNWVISDTIARALKQMKLEYPPPLINPEKYKVV